MEKISTVSHTLSESKKEKLRNVAFHSKVSESAIIEVALDHYFGNFSQKDIIKKVQGENLSLRRKAVS